MTKQNGHTPSDDGEPIAIEVWLITPAFPLGIVVATPGALEILEAAGRRSMEFLARHAQKDWGDLGDDDRETNDQELIHGGRLLSAYTVSATERIWIITEWDRSVTTILLPSEY